MSSQNLRRTTKGLAMVIAALPVVVLVLLGLGPHTGRYRTLTVLSGSMRPHFDAGSVAVVTPVAPRDVEVGDVIVFQAPNGGHTVSHRVIEVLEPGDQPVLRTKGDGNPAPDPLPVRLVGSPAWKVRFAVPSLGYAINWIQQPDTRRLAVTAMPIFLAVIWLAEIWSAPGAPTTRSPVSYMASDILPHRGRRRPVDPPRRPAYAAADILPGRGKTRRWLGA